MIYGTLQCSKIGGRPPPSRDPLQQISVSYGPERPDNCIQIEVNRLRRLPFESLTSGKLPHGSNPVIGGEVDLC